MQKNTLAQILFYLYNDNELYFQSPVMMQELNQFHCTAVDHS